MTENSISAAVVADDQELFRLGLAEILRRDFKFGRVIEAASLDDVITVTNATSGITFVSLELSIPGMKGAASVRALRHAMPTTRITVISAFDKREDILRLLQAGVHGFVPKTLGIPQIKDALRQIIEGRIYVPTSISDNSEKILYPCVNCKQFQDEKNLKIRELSPRQMQVLGLMAKGYSYKKIAGDLGLTDGTVKVHVNALFRKLGVNSRATAVTLLSQLISSSIS